MPLKAVAFDWGHTVMDECGDRDVPLDVRPVHLMPDVSEVLPQIALPLALWANTRVASEIDVRGWLERAGLNALFRWVITSVDAGARKPAPQFFHYALARCELAREEILRRATRRRRIRLERSMTFLLSCDGFTNDR